MSLMSMLAFLAAPVVRLAAKDDRLTDREVKVIAELAAARDENIKLKSDVARLVTQVLNERVEREHWSARAEEWRQIALGGFSPDPRAAELRMLGLQYSQMQAQAAQQQAAQDFTHDNLLVHGTERIAAMGVGPGVFGEHATRQLHEMRCNCVPSRSQVWAAEQERPAGLRQIKAGELGS